MKPIAILGTIVGILITIIVIPAVFISGVYNRANEMEQGVNGAYKNNQNLLAGYEQKLLEAAQVPAMQAEDFSKVFKAALESRYGAEGSQAALQLIVEQNPNIDSKVYTKLQQIIEAGRDEFKSGQTQLIDRCRVYDTERGYLVSGSIMRLLGFPKLDITKICTPIVTGRTEETFESGKEKAPIKLR